MPDAAHHFNIWGSFYGDPPLGYEAIFIAEPQFLGLTTSSLAALLEIILLHIDNNNNVTPSICNNKKTVIIARLSYQV
jgi:hypothetical protein